MTDHYANHENDRHNRYALKRLAFAIQQLGLRCTELQGGEAADRWRDALQEASATLELPNL